MMAAMHAALIAPWIAWIPALPLCAFAVLILVGRRLGHASAWLSVMALTFAFFLTIAAAPTIFDGAQLAVRWTWLFPSDPRWTVGFAIDGLTWIMLCVITFIGTLIQIYSIGYMHDDPRFSRFFAYLSLFCASMLLLVLADNYVLLYAGWELVGLCSYLLISFWFEKPAAANAGRKAFLTTRVGDTGMLIGIMLLAWSAKDLTFAHLPLIREQLLHAHSPGLLTLISGLLFMGAAGKSAQIPLHVWLPDAMEGPTPVSALIHAATMVAAGVYLVARSMPLFTPQSLTIVLAIGLATHLFAGTVALTMTDIKKVLAYSTISQLGLMFSALGLGSVPYAVFHLVTHAFFKALLFLGAGSVIHGTHHQDMEHLGGLIDTMRWTALTFLIAALAMSGMFPLSGFWSKDAILLEAQHNAPGVFWLLTAGAVMTTCYVFRLYLRTFHGPQSHEATHAHEAGPIMTIPLAILAVGAAFVGLLGSPFAHHWLFGLLQAHEVHEGLDLGMLVMSFVILSAGFSMAWVIGLKRRSFVPKPISRVFYQLAVNKYFVDEAYDALIIKPFFAATRALSSFDGGVVDGMVNLAGSAGWALAQIKQTIDRTVVDGLVNGVARMAQAAGRAGRRLQSGVIHQYLLGVAAAVVVLAALCIR